MFLLYIAIQCDIIILESRLCMYLKACPGYKNKIYLSFVQGYRDESGKTKQKTIEKIGYLEDLKKIYDDPIAHFKEIAKQRNAEEVNELVIKNINTKIIDESNPRKNLGYIIPKRIYKELGIYEFLKEKSSKLKIEYNLQDIFELLVYSRILFPNSKLSTYNHKDMYFENYNFSEKNMYRSFDYLANYKDEILKLCWNNTKDLYNRDTSNTYYDTTNYYFEISYNDIDKIDENGNVIEKGLRKKGPSKEHRKSPIVQMGLLMDNNGLPMYYDLFPGNESEKTQMRPTLKKTKAKFDIGRTVIVADRGQNTSDNTVFIAGKNDDDKTNHDGYVYGQSIIGADEEFRNWAVNQEGFITDIILDENNNEIHFKHKSRIFAKNVQIKKNNQRTVKYQIYQKQMVYYSQKYADKQKYERELAILKAKDLIANPGKYTQATSYGCTKYINNISFNKKTGEVADDSNLSLNLDKIKDEEKFDGYYSIVTSEKHLSDKEIRDIYKGLWKIEETFKITKSELETRPIFVWTPESIETHFLSCFIALLIIRLLEQKTNRKYSNHYIIDSLKKYSSTKIEHDIYLQDFRNDVIKDLEKTFNIDLSHKYLTLSQIKKLLNF